MTKFREITPVNGFDCSDRNNAMQNNYAWSMAELENYIYVGTGRNIAYGALSSFGLRVPEVLTPPGPVIFRGEIWRYTKNDESCWQLVLRTPESLPTLGFRFMIRYKDALYAVPYVLNQNNIVIYKSTNGTQWRLLDTGIQGNNTRAMTIHRGRLYMGVLNTPIGGATEPLLYVTDDPENQGWTQIVLSGTPGQNPRGGIDTLISFNDRLYVGTSPPGGFELWRSLESTPRTNRWKLVIDKGGGDALNEVPLTLAIFKNHLFVGTAIALAIQSTDPEKQFVPPKGADLFRVDQNDIWKVIIGGRPIAPTNPTTGTRNLGLYPSGLGNLTNAYIWSLQEHQGKFYLGTFDWSDLFIPIVASLFTINRDILLRLIALFTNPEFLINLLGEYNWLLWLEAALRALNTFIYTMGFDLYVSEDGFEWERISLNGLGNPKNYGLRTMLSSRNGNLYLGTANPFQGCEVWVKEGRKVPDHCDLWPKKTKYGHKYPTAPMSDIEWSEAPIADAE